MAKKLKTFYGIEGNKDKTFLIMVPSGKLVSDFLELVRTKQKNQAFAHVWFEGAEIDHEEEFDPIYSPDAIYYISITDEPPKADIMQSLVNSKSGGLSFVKSNNNPQPYNPPVQNRQVNPPPQQPYRPPVQQPVQQRAPPVNQYPDIDNMGNKDNNIDDITKTRVNVNKNTIGISANERNKTRIEDGKFLVLTTATPDSMFNGTNLNINMNMNTQQVTDVIIPYVQTIYNYKTPIQLILYMSSGVPFTSGTLNDFFSLQENYGLDRKIYAIVTRNIKADLLDKPQFELCNASNPDQRLLLSPIVDSTEIGLTHIACLLGYLNHDGANTDLFIRSIAKVSGFAPLITELTRIQNRNEVTGRSVATVTTSLHTIFTSILPERTDPGRVFEYSLRCSCFIRHVNDVDPTIPIKNIDWKKVQGSDLKTYLEQTKHKNILISWTADMGAPFTTISLTRPDPLAIENAHNTMASFKPFPPLSIRGVNGSNIIKGVGGRTMLFLHDTMQKDQKYANNIDVINPLTGMTEPTDVEELAKSVGDESVDKSANLIDPSRVTQIVQVCFDESGSMIANLDGYRCSQRDDIERITIANQYLTAFANRTYGYRISCVQGLISFNDVITERAPLSPLVPDFEDGILHVKPSGTTHLWDALEKAANDLAKFNVDPAKPNEKKYPKAQLRIVVISDGDDVGSTATPHEVCAKLIQMCVIVDAVIITNDSSVNCNQLCALCHITGGLAFRPKTISEGLEIFEQEAFLSCENRKKVPKFRKTLTEDLFNQYTTDAQFDVTTINQIITTAVSNTKLTTPETVIGRNQNTEIPNPRHRRVLRELHYAAEVQHNVPGEKNDNYDPDLRILTFSSNMDKWRVYIRGPEGTPYADKWWYLYVTFPEEYPIQPPIFRFVSVPYHLNVSSEGRICLNIIEKGYMSTTKVVELIQQIKELFLHALEDTPIQIEKLMMYKHNRQEYDRRAFESTRNNAKDTYEQWIEGITITDTVPPGFKLTFTEESVPPYMRSIFTGKPIDRAKLIKDKDGNYYDRDEFQQYIAGNKNPINLCTGKEIKYDLDDFN